MNTEPENTEASLHPMDVMREYYTASGITFQEDDSALFTRLNLMNTEVQVICWGEPNDTATVLVRLPLRAAPEVREKAGEFVNRMNFGAKRKFWEIDCDSGELRLTSYTDTLVGPLTAEFFRAILNALLAAADATFPYLTGVLTGRMLPAFAADQAEAGIRTAWQGREE